MPRRSSPEAPSPFETRAERAGRESIFSFTTTETDPDSGERYEKKWVSVLGIELEVYDPEREGGEGTNFSESDFHDFFKDNKAKEILKFYATAVKLNHAPLIEGETDIGKTKALEYLAFLTNHKLVRISMRGTTDPSEFFGKYVPESATAQSKILAALARKQGLTGRVRKLIEQARSQGRSLSLKDLKEFGALQSEALSGLEETSREFFRRAAAEGRGLTREEWEQLAAAEGIDLEGKPFVWQDGEIVKAMRGNNGRGYWVYQDEIGAAEPQILVAKNRILEQFGRIELSEDGGRLVEAGPHFRDFSTTNPPEYVGRLPLAPDFLRRWVYRKESPLDEKSLKERLEHTMRELPLERDIQELFLDVLTVFHFSLRASIKNIVKHQKQKFNYEFSDLIRVRDYLRVFGAADPLAALRDAMDYAVFGKIGDAKTAEDQKKNFETLLTAKKIPEKVKEIIERRRPSASIKKVLATIEDSVARF